VAHACYPWRLRWEDHLSSGVPDQPKQHTKNLYLKKIIIKKVFLQKKSLQDFLIDEIED
jgi:hypothetical protein